MGKFRDGNIIALQTSIGKFVSVQPKGEVTQSTDLGQTEHFLLKKVGKKIINLVSSLDTKMIVTNLGKITHKKDRIFTLPGIDLSDERFMVIKVDHNLFGLRSWLGTFLSAHYDGTMKLSKILTPSCLFKAQIIQEGQKKKRKSKIKIGKSYYIQSFYKGFLNSTEENQIRQMFRENPRKEDIFTIESEGDGLHLFSPYSGKYLVANSDGSVSLESNYHSGKGFQGISRDDKIVFKTSFGTYISAQKNGGILQRNIITNSEKFDTFKVKRVE